MSDQTLTMMVHGDAGAGKSWLGDTTPAPRLILDAEGRAKYLPSQPKLKWNPYQEEPPKEAGEWETCVATVQDFATMERVYQWLQTDQHCFSSVVMDSLMEVQKRLIDDVRGFEALDQRDWGLVLRRLEKLVRDYRDLTNSPHNPVTTVIATVGSRNIDGKQVPLLQGQLRDTVPYFFDTVGYLYTSVHPEDPAQITRSLLVQPTPAAIAKDGTGRLPGPIIQDPNIGDLFQLLNGHVEAG
jgi:hypothetical protein